MPIELVSDEQLRAAAAVALEKFQHQPGYQAWAPKLASHLTKVRDASREQFIEPSFQEMLWESEAISATGMGRIDVSSVISNPEIAGILWDLRNLKLSDDQEQRWAQIREAWVKLRDKLDPLLKRWPTLKMYRVFAALFPQDFTTIAYARKLRQLAKAMGFTEISRKHPVDLHARVLRRLSEVLGRVPAPPSAEGIKRMSLPWLLYAAHIQDQGDEATVIDDPASGTERLNPLPAARRRKGLLAIGGYLPAIRSMIEFANEGCTREDMKEHIRSVNPKLADSSIAININALIAEWGVLKPVGNELTLTPRGEGLLETGDPAEVSDWLLTRVLGFDNVLTRLRKSPAAVDELGAMLQEVNPGWTTRFAPDVLVKWVTRLGLAEVDGSGLLRLTADGVTWASRIHWEPESLPKDTLTLPTSGGKAARETRPVSTRPSVSEMLAVFPPNAAFPAQLVVRLDAGLWHNERRHFAVLTGLSGAGKTLLARSYGRSLWAGSKNPGEGVFILPVQPDWHDPSSLLGYVSPLLDNTYIRTGFLEFLLRAAGNPDRPYTIILDEMNLSHPEQYLAPLLSAMETGDPIEFHTSEDEITGVPPRIPYPSNLVIIGTVNMDETTHGLSDKVLDRACVIDFWEVDVDAYPGWKQSGLSTESGETVRTVLKGLSDALRPVRLHFGWRTIEDVIGIVRAATASGKTTAIQALDQAIYGKILPKLRGEDTERLRLAFDNAVTILKSAGLPDSAAKLSELAEDLRLTGSARFWR